MSRKLEKDQELILFKLRVTTIHSTTACVICRMVSQVGANFPEQEGILVTLEFLFKIDISSSASCGHVLTSHSLSSGSGPASPRCFTCTDTTRGCHTVTPPQPPPMPSRDQRHPHRPDAGGHLCHLLCAQFHSAFYIIV